MTKLRKGGDEKGKRGLPKVGKIKDTCACECQQLDKIMVGSKKKERIRVKHI